MKVGTDAMILGSICTFLESPKNILDIGTGTGVISLMLAQRFKPERITAIEIDEAASKDAQYNFNESNFPTTFNLIHQDIRLMKLDLTFDAIISNPPFFENSSKSISDQRNLARHTDNLSYADLMEAVASRLTNTGLFWVIVPYEVFDFLCNLGKDFGLSVFQYITIYGKPDKPIRSVVAFSKTIHQLTTDNLTIRDAFGNYTDSYIELTKSFHSVDLSQKKLK